MNPTRWRIAGPWPPRASFAMSCAAALSLTACATATPTRPEAQARAAALYGPEAAEPLESPRLQEPPWAGAPSLNALVDYAIQHNPGLRAGFERWRAALERIPQVTALPDPRLTWAHFIEEVQTRTGPQENRFSIAQTLPWFGKLGLRGEAAARQAEGLWWGVEALRLQVVREVKLAWCEYAYLAQAIRISEENLTLLRQFEPIVQRKVQTGAGQGDLLRLQVEIGQAENELASLRAQRPAIAARLAAVLSVEAMPAPQWPPPIETEAVSIAIDPLRERMLATNPDLQALHWQIEAAASVERLARLDRYPDFTLGLDYIDTGAAISPGVGGSSEDPYSFSVGINLPLWRRKYDARERETALARSAAEEQYRHQRDMLLSELELRVYEIEDAGRRLNLYRDTLIPRARQAFELMLVAYEAGTADLLDVIESQRDILNFEKAYWRAASDIEKRRADLESLTGGPLS